MASSQQEQTAILLLGGTGKVGSRIVPLLQHTNPASSREIIVASRKGTAPSGTTGVKFDWENPETYGNPFAAVQKGKPSGARSRIGAVFLVAPSTANAASLVTDFVDFARTQGVARFVLLSASVIEAGGPAMGKIHAYLQDLAKDGDIEWAVLRPTWFQENLAETAGHRNKVKEEGKIYSAAGDGKIPWVSVDDIAAVAVQALTAPDAPNTDYLILGPELLSYEDIADILSDILEKKVVHVNLTSQELEQRFLSSGIPEEYAKMLSAMDTAIKHGAENRLNDVVLSVTGKLPKTFREYAESVKEVWQ